MTSAKDLKKGNYIMVSNEVYQITRKEVVVFGTHSHSKTKLFVQGLFSKGEKSFNFSHTDNIEELDIIRKTGQVISKLPDKIQVMDTHSYETFDAESDLYDQIKEGDEVTFINFRGNVKVVEKR